MDQVVFFLFCAVTAVYVALLYGRRRPYVATMYWLGCISISFILPNLLRYVSGQAYTFGYSLGDEDFARLNTYYLLALVAFVVSNVATLGLGLGSSMGSSKRLNYATARRANTAYGVLSAGIFVFAGLRGFDLASWSLPSSVGPVLDYCIPAVVFGLNLTAWVRFMLSRSASQKIISACLLVYAVSFGLMLGFARRLVIYPVVIAALYHLVVRDRKPRIGLAVIGVAVVLAVIMPLMVSVRTHGIVDGLTSFGNVLAGDPDSLVGFLQMSTDVSWSYSAAAIIVKTGLLVTPLTLLKPITIVIPRSLWAAKPLPMSLTVVRELRLVDNPNMSIPPGLVGEAHAYFGVLGVLLAGFLWGILCGYLDERIRSRQGNEKGGYDWNAFVLLVLTVQIVTGAIRGDTSTTLLETEFVVIPFLLVMRLSRLRVRA